MPGRFWPSQQGTKNSRLVHNARTTVLNRPEQVDPVIYDAFNGHARQRHDCIYFVLIGYSETRSVSARSVLDAGIPTRPFTLEFTVRLG